MSDAVTTHDAKVGVGSRLSISAHPYQCRVRLRVECELTGDTAIVYLSPEESDLLGEALIKAALIARK